MILILWGTPPVKGRKLRKRKKRETYRRTGGERRGRQRVEEKKIKGE